jgi:hypothetical protein
VWGNDVVVLGRVRSQICHLEKALTLVTIVYGKNIVKFVIFHEKDKQYSFFHDPSLEAALN